MFSSTWDVLRQVHAKRQTIREATYEAIGFWHLSPLLL
jgi:hypothetical protein